MSVMDVIKRRRRAQRGVTLIEVLLAIAVGAVVIMGAVLFYMTASGNAKLNDAMSQVQAVAGNIRSLYSGRACCTGLNNTLAIQGKVFSADMYSANPPTAADVRNPWGGAVTVEEVSVGARRGFSITYTDIPNEACARMVTQTTSGLGGGVISIVVSGGSGGTYGQTSVPTVEEALDACSAANDLNQIVWTLR